MLEQVRIGATVFARDGANWVGTVLLDDAELAMPEIEVVNCRYETFTSASNYRRPKPTTDPTVRRKAATPHQLSPSAPANTPAALGNAPISASSSAS